MPTCPVILTNSDPKDLISMGETVALMREAMLSLREGFLQAPPRLHTNLGQGDLVFTIGGEVGKKNGSCGFRVYHSLTPSEAEINQVTAIFDTATGLLDGVYIGDKLGEWRCGAIGGLAIKQLSPRDVKTLGILGCGRQARTQILGAITARDFEEIMVFSRNPTKRQFFAQTMSEITQRHIVAANSAREVVEFSDVLICATSSQQPILNTDWLKSDIHINQIGCKCAGKSELPVGVYESASLLVTDSLAQAKSMGYEFVLSEKLTKNSLLQLSNFIDVDYCRIKKGRSIFISLGLAGTEVILASELIKRSKHREVQSN